MVVSLIPKFLAAAQFEQPSFVIYFNSSILNFVENDLIVGDIFRNTYFHKYVSQKPIKENTNRIMCVAMASLRLGLCSRSAYFRK